MDFHYALRSFARNPLFAAAIVLTLAIGIGPTTAVFSIVDAMLLRDLPYRDAGSLVAVWRNRNANDRAPVSGPDFDDFRRSNVTLSDMAISSSSTSYNLGSVDRPVRINGARVTPNFFSVMVTAPLIGALPPKAGSQKMVVLSEGLWRSAFRESAEVLGQQIRLNAEPHQIVAVMPAAFAYPEEVQLWVPFELTAENLGHRAYHQYRVVGRLKPGATVASADADLKRIAARLGETYPETTRGIGVTVITMRENLAGAVRRPLLVLFGAVVFLLLITCSNAANLMLTRAEARRRELAIRSALGATARRLSRQLLTESLLLSLAGGVLGLVIAQGCLAVARALGTSYLARPDLITLDGRVLAFNLAVVLLAGVLFGFSPIAFRNDRFSSLTNRTETPGREGNLLRSSVLVSVVALSFVLLIGAALMICSFQRLRAVDVGLRPERLVTFRIFLPETPYAEIPKRTAFYERLLERLREVSAIEAAAMVSGLPLENTMSGDIVFPGEPDPIAARRIASFTEVSPGFFETAGVPLLAGRDFTRDDTLFVGKLLEAMGRGESVTPPPIVINEVLAQRFWGSRSPLGDRLLVGGDFPGMIVGVVGNIRQRGVSEEVPPHVYFPLGTPLPPRPASFMVRSSLPATSVESVLRRILHEMDPEIPPYDVRTMDAVIARSIVGSRFQATVLAVFAATALLLALIGIYAVVSYSVTRRTREIGIRMATGATGRDVLELMMTRVMKLAILGVTLGLCGALLLTRWIEDLLYQVDVADSRLFLFVGFILLATSAAASASPARRAVRVDPVIALRNE